MRVRLALLALFCAACSLLQPLDEYGEQYGKQGIEPTPDAGDASSGVVDSGGDSIAPVEDAAIDRDAQEDAAPKVGCAARTTPSLLCADFDGTVPFQFLTPKQDQGDLPVVVDTAFISNPRSVRCSVPAKATDVGIATSRLTHEFLQTLSEITVSFSIRVDQTTGEQTLLSLAWPDYALALRLRPNEMRLRETTTSAQLTSLGTFPVGTWVRVALTAKKTGASSSTVDVTFDGQSRLAAGPLLYHQYVTGPGPNLSIGFLFVETPTTAVSLHLDDVVVEGK